MEPIRSITENGVPLGILSEPLMPFTPTHLLAIVPAVWFTDWPHEFRASRNPTDGFDFKTLNDASAKVLPNGSSWWFPGGFRETVFVGASPS